ncbi:hypothetical protein HPB51_006380 [Rhipicephalus microplus]|uniref:Tick transposon n=1 Tax=Rhipicephalus microplus TaxID=6941 RepID=A0A9J6DM07_RHIMP|nr:hypothetical protein HPB51_006380 [Rhipicephalus microplus]
MSLTPADPAAANHCCVATSEMPPLTSTVANDGPIPPKPPLLRKTATPTRPRRRHCFQLRREGHQPFGSVCLSACDCFCAEPIRRADETTSPNNRSDDPKSSRRRRCYSRHERDKRKSETRAPRSVCRKRKAYRGSEANTPKPGAVGRRVETRSASATRPVRRRFSPLRRNDADVRRRRGERGPAHVAARPPRNDRCRQRNPPKSRAAPAQSRVLSRRGPGAQEIGRDIARHLVVLPLPRNVHPQRNEERRVARALAETHASDSTAVYVDAAKHQYRPHTYVALVVRAPDGKLLNACKVRATSAEQAEEATIALALNGTPEVTTILSDSRTAIANLGRGSIGTPAASLLPRSKSTTKHLRWFPAHVGAIPGGAANRNEMADAVARELAHRAAPPSYAEEVEPPDSDPPLDYGSILQRYREGRRALPGPHPRREGVLLRQDRHGAHARPGPTRVPRTKVRSAVSVREN